ncbi:MAG: AAA family ATPase [Methylococcales bacterium]
MKILRLHFKNINSLEGENQLDFNQVPLIDAGVFAITGPNGSGKSSILDVITLALYGETFKFDRPAEHVMTRHTAACFAEVEFRVNNMDYRSRWQVQREQENEAAAILPASMVLTRLADGETVLATDFAKVRALVAEIVGLDFRSFTRSTLLAQGDFAAFLNALDSERLDILEKIVSTDIYVAYKQDVISKEQQEQAKLTSLQADLAAIPLLDAVTQEAREHDLADFKAQLYDFEQNLQALTQQMSSLQSLAAIEEQQQQMQLKYQTLQGSLQQIMADLQRIEVAQPALVLQQEVIAVESQQTVLDEDQLTLTHYREELALLKAQLEDLGATTNAADRVMDRSVTEQQQLISDLSFQVEQINAENHSEQTSIQILQNQLNQKRAETLTVKTWLEKHNQDASLLEGFPDLGQLRKLSAQIGDLKQQQKSSKQKNAQLKTNQSGVQAILKQTPELQNQLTAYEAELKNLLKDHQPEELLALRGEQQERVKDFKELILLAKIQSRFKESWLVRLGLVRPQQELDTAVINQQLDELSKRLFIEENIKKTLEHAVFNESLLRKMQTDRIHLVKHEPCPLCGALKHPFFTHPPSIGDSKQALTDQTARVQIVNANVTKLQQQLKAAQKQIDNKQLRADRLTRIQSEWATLCNRLNVASSDLNIDKIAPIKKLLNKQLLDLKDIERVIKAVSEYQKKIAGVKAQIETQAVSLARLQGKVQEMGVISNPLEESNALSQSLAQCLAEEKQLSLKVAAQLTQLGEKMPSKSKEDALFDRLNKRRQDYQTYLLRDKKLLEEIEVLQQKINTNQAGIAAQSQRLKECTTKLQLEQISGLHLALIEKQKLINEKELKIAQLKTRQQSMQQVLQAQAEEFGIPSYAELLRVFQLLPQQAALQQEQQALTLQIEQHAQALEKVLAEKQSVQVLVNPEQNQTSCEAEQHSLLEKMEITRLEVQRLDELLTKQNSRQEKYTLTLDKIAEQQVRYEQACAELQQALLEQGHAFRRKVQRKTADKLLTRTNQILEKISGRFYVRQGDNEQGLALEVEDTYQQNTRRLPKTLSGGESFVVSLALALGLSELASNGQAIESLFLDEGFGNLDAEALYTVVSTLENLQTQGKKVGVISHVDGVRKRIKTQIEMTKKPSGLSEFKLLV